MFQWRGVCFLDGWASFLSRGCAPWGASVLIGFFFFEQIVGWEGMPPLPSPPPHYGKPCKGEGDRTFQKLSHLGGTKFIARKGK